MNTLILKRSVLAIFARLLFPVRTVCVLFFALQITTCSSKTQSWPDGKLLRTAAAVLRLCSSKVHIRCAQPKTPPPKTPRAPWPTLVADYRVRSCCDFFRPTRMQLSRCTLDFVSATNFQLFSAPLASEQATQRQPTPRTG